MPTLKTPNSDASPKAPVIQTPADMLLGSPDKPLNATISTLKAMRADMVRYMEAAKSKRRKMRPSERAMTIAHYAIRLDALDNAIKILALTRYMSDSK